MNNISDICKLFLQVIVSAFGAAGLIEFLKNFIKTDKKIVYAIIMPPITVGCFLATYYLSPVVIGSVIAIGTVQLNYQIIIQGFAKLVTKSVDKISDKSLEG